MKNNIITISLIFLFSIVLWGTISLKEEYFTTIKIPIKLIAPADSIAVSDVSVSEVTINLKGQGWQLAKLSLTKDLNFALRVRNKFGRQSINAKSELENNPWFSSNFQITEIIPENINLHVEKLRTKYLKIIPRINLGFKEGFSQVDKIILSRDSVKVFGPWSILRNIDSIFTKEYTFNNLDKKIHERIEIDVHSFMKYNTSFVYATIDIQKIVDKIFTNVLIETIDVPPSYILQPIPNSVDVKLRGGINVLGKMNSEDIKAIIDFRSAFVDTLGFLEPTIQIPPYSTIIEVKPNKIEYIIKQY